jgi:putative tryptophan/tyrosine transport system permease protein
VSLFAFLGALQSGLIYALVGLGVFVAFRAMGFPDLTADGSFPLGAAAAATAVVAGLDPWLSVLLAIFAGAAAGLVTGWISEKLRIQPILAGLLMMTALYSINLRVMGQPNTALLGKPTIFTELAWTGLSRSTLVLIVLALFVVVVKLLLDWFLSTDAGLALRARGSNQRMAEANGISSTAATLTGLAIANACVALGGALFAHSQGFADVTMGIGTIIVGLAAVIIGEVAFRTGRIIWLTAGCIVGSVIYWIFITLATMSGRIGLQPSDLNLVTAVLVGAAMALPLVRQKLRVFRTQPT